MRSRQISAASPRSCRQTPATAEHLSKHRRPISRGWRPATLMAMWRPAGPETPLPARSRSPPRPTQPAGSPTRVEAMRAKIKAGGHASPYRLRKQLPEPVFGQIKQARGFRQFLLRGIDKVRAEWAIVCTAHNLLKLAHRRNLSAALPLAAVAA